TPELVQIVEVRYFSDSFNAIAQSLKGPPLTPDLSQDLIESLIHPTRFALDVGSDALPAMARTLARLPYTRPAQLDEVDEFLVSEVGRVDRAPDRRGLLADLARAADSRARLLGGVKPASDDLIVWLRRLASNSRRTSLPPIRVNAMQALIAARGVDL